MGSIAVTVCAGGSSPIEEAGTDSAVVADVSSTVEDGASRSNEATDDDRHSIVVTGSVKVAGACSGDGIWSPIRALYENEIWYPADESNTSYEAEAECGVKPERRGVNWGTCSKPEEIAP